MLLRLFLLLLLSLQQQVLTGFSTVFAAASASPGASNRLAQTAQFNFSNNPSVQVDSAKKTPRFKLKLVHRDDIINSNGMKTTKTTDGRPVHFYLPIYEVAPFAAEKEVVPSDAPIIVQNKINFNKNPELPKNREKATLWLFSDLLTSESAQTNSFHRAQHHHQQGHQFQQINGKNKNNNNNHHHHPHHHPNQINSRPARDNFNKNNNNQWNKHPHQLDQRVPVKNGHQGLPMMPQNSHSNGHLNGHQNRQPQNKKQNENSHQPNQHNRPSQFQQQKNFQGPPRQNPSNQQFNHPPNNNGNNKNSNAQPNLNNQNQNQHPNFRPLMNHAPPNNSRQNNNNFPNHRPHNNPNSNQISNHPMNQNAPMKNGNGGQNHNNNHNNPHNNNIINHINDHLNNPKPLNGQSVNNNYDRPNNEHPPLNRNKPRDKYTEEVQSHNLDSEHFPHQYAIQIRWGKPGEMSELAKKTENSPSQTTLASPLERKFPMEDRTMNDEKSRYRQFAHQEEEHWHDKKWINLGEAPKEVDDVGSLPENDQLYAVSQEKFKTLPVFVRPLRNDASMETVHEHFAVPSKSFPVNRRFVEWANAPVQMRSHRVSVAKSRRNSEEADMGRNGQNRRQRRGHWRRLRRF